MINQGCYNLFNNLGSYRNMILERKTGKEILKSSRLVFLETFLTNNFALLDSGDNTSGPLVE